MTTLERLIRDGANAKDLVDMRYKATAVKYARKRLRKTYAEK